MTKPTVRIAFSTLVKTASLKVEQFWIKQRVDGTVRYKMFNVTESDGKPLTGRVAMLQAFVDLAVQFGAIEIAVQSNGKRVNFVAVFPKGTNLGRADV